MLLRAATWTMLRESVARLAGATGAVRLPFVSQPGILSWIVAGSVARGEAVPDSDIDFNVLLTSEALDGLKKPRDLKRKDINAGRLLIRREERLRQHISAQLVERLQAEHIPAGDALTLKPFCLDCLREEGPLSVAPIIYSTLIFCSVPASGADQYYCLLDQALVDQDALRLGLFTLLVLMRGAEYSLDTGDRALAAAAVRKALHRVATAISAVIAVGRRDADPQVPYWWIFEGSDHREIAPDFQHALLRFLVAVTLARATTQRDPDQPQLLVEQAMNTLARVLDELEENARARGDRAAAEFWRQVLGLFGDPAETRRWATMLNVR